MQTNVHDILAEDFQLTVQHFLKRNANLLDTLSKYQAASARLNRAVLKAATQCGCLSVSGKKNAVPETGISGALCKNCKQVAEKELGDALFYLAALCNTLDFSIYDIMLREKQTLSLLGEYSLT